MIGIQLNQIAVWQAKRLDGLSVKSSPAGRRVLDGKDEVKTTKKTYRYAKNYQIGEGDDALRYSLLTVTYDSAKTKVEEDLDRIALVLTREEVTKILESKDSLGYTPYFIKERTK